MNNPLGDSVSKRILIYLFNNQDSLNFEFKIAKEIDCDSSSCSKNINLLKNIGLINSMHKSQMNVITLTEKGKKIASCLNKIERLI